MGRFRLKHPCVAEGARPDGGVVTQRTANPYTPVRFRLGPPHRQPQGRQICAALAQLVEHIIRNDGVTGSSPVSGTTSFSLVLLPFTEHSALEALALIARPVFAGAFVSFHDMTKADGC